MRASRKTKDGVAARPTTLFRLPCLLLALSMLACAGPCLAKASRPNILFAIADDWGVHAGAYGTPWIKTPTFDRVAREGLLFRNAYTPNAKCAPSRACILTGRNPWQLKAAANHVCFFPPEFKSWGEALADHGWFVGYTQKGWGPGVAVDAGGNPRQMTGQPFNAHKRQPPATGISNNDYAANFAAFIETAPKGQPWCFWYGAVEPHRGYEFGSGVTKGGKRLADIERVPGYWPDNDTVRHDMLDYAFEVQHFDRHLGRMLEMLEEKRLLDNTLVIVTSDHGMPFPRVKGNAYPFANRVPLAVMWKEGIARPGRVIEDWLSFIDLAPTLMDVAGLRWPETGMATPAGRSFADVFQSPSNGVVDPARNHVLIGKERTDIGRPNDAGYPTRGIVRGSWLYLRNFEPTRWPAGNPETGYLDCDGGATKSAILEAHRANLADPFWTLCFGIRPPEELYELSTDPDCLRNLAGSAGLSATQAALTDMLFHELRKQEDPRMLGQGPEFDEFPYADAGHADFHERFMRGEKIKAGWVSATDFEPFSPPQSIVSIEPRGGGWRLLRNGQPFLVKGAVAFTAFDALARAGANAIRTGANARTLDQAQRLGLAVLVNLPLGKPRSGFDYTNSSRLAAQRERIRELVLRFKDHPAVLMWAIGNEPTIFTPEDQRALLWKEVNRLAELVRWLDPAHPVISVVGGEQWRSHLGELDVFCPALEAVGLNAYADMLNLPEELARQAWRRPYLVTEFGPRGHWQVAKTSWGARLEDSSTEKAQFYRQAYEHAVKERPQCLGAFGFLWGWKMEKTHTWYGMFLPDGSRTESVDTMTYLWFGQWPTNRCPAIGPSRIRLQRQEGEAPAEPGVFAPGDQLHCRVDASDPDGDPLTIEWDLRRDVSDDPRVGGDFEPLEPAIEAAVLNSQGYTALVRVPDQPGKYRVFVYVRDGQGGAATANVPIQAASQR